MKKEHFGLGIYSFFETGVGVFREQDSRQAPVLHIGNFGSGLDVKLDVKTISQRQTFSGTQEVIVAESKEHRYYLTDKGNGAYDVLRIDDASDPRRIILDGWYKIDRPSAAFFCAGTAAGIVITGATLINTPPTDILPGQFTNLLAIACLVGVLGTSLWNAHKYVNERGGLKAIMDEYEHEKAKDFFGSDEFSRLLHSRELATILAMLLLVGGTCALGAILTNVAGAPEGLIAVAMLGMVAGSVIISDQAGKEIKEFIDRNHEDTSKSVVRQ